MNKEEFIEDFLSQSTLKLVGLSILTLGIYIAHFMYNQTKKINKKLDVEKQIPLDFLKFIVVLTYASVIFYALSIIYFEIVSISRISEVFSNVLWLASMVWAVMVRNRMNDLFEYEKDNNMWFNLLWSILFTPFYFNYKIGCIKEKMKLNA